MKFWKINILSIWRKQRRTIESKRQHLATENQQAQIIDVIEVKNGAYLHKN